MKKKPTLEDLNVWKKFIFSKKPIKDKDVYLDQNKSGQFLTKKIDLHGYTLDEANLKTKELLFHVENLKLNILFLSLKTSCLFHYKRVI